MRVLVACEFSGIVREAFIAKGHEAVSCDLMDTDIDGPHIKDDVMRHLDDGWDMMVAFPPCTHLAVSGARWWWYKEKEQVEAQKFVWDLMNAPIKKICIENPVGIISRNIRQPDQIIQPWMFGHGETKATCLWLDGLAKLIPTDVVNGREARVHRMPPGPNRAKERGRTYEGIARAMAAQWG